MTKPLGYYADTNIPVVGDIEREYGSNLQDMSQQCKLFLIRDIAGNLLLDNFDPEREPKIFELANRIRNEMSEEDDAIALIKAIANNL
ncbi:MAG: hypothetical protein QNJ36_16845 [Calothrix sp. MO_167.B42]|nr:hypothetical protein [Calothrix sp. MO_167.B42]